MASSRSRFRSCSSRQCRLHGTCLEGEGTPGAIPGKAPSRSFSSACRSLELMGFHLYRGSGWGWAGDAQEGRKETL